MSSYAVVVAVLLGILALSCATETNAGTDADASTDDTTEGAGGLEETDAMSPEGDSRGGETSADEAATEGTADALDATRPDGRADVLETMDSEPLRVLDTATQVSIGMIHSCALLRDGTVACWGHNSLGELGDGTLERRRPNATRVTDLRNATQIAGASLHTCARLGDGTMTCWGSNFKHALGVDTSERCGGGECSRTPKTVPGLKGVEEVGAGAGFTCSRLKDKTVRCWGGGGSIGDGTYIDRPSPTPVRGLDNVVALSVSEGHACARIDDGTVKCWGGNGYGQLGFVSTDCLHSIPEPHSECSTTARTVTGLSNVVQIASGSTGTCARSSDGSVRCWGLGFGRAPQLVMKDSAASIATFIGACARTTSRKATCWGNVYPGDGADVRDVALADGGLEVPALKDVDYVAVGRHQCVVVAGGIVKCWGKNDSGQLGDGTTMKRLTPVSVLW